jgi:hypothetical protein
MMMDLGVVPVVALPGIKWEMGVSSGYSMG